MTIGNIIGSLLIGPLKLAFGIIYELAYRMVGHPGLAIIFLSLIMNILVLPLYRRADVMQAASRDVEAKLQPGVERIKKAFKGDERMMILQTYYRQNNYKPIHALNGSVSLLLQIPFFTAAFQFLSNLDILKGVSLGPIKDLSAPDGLIVIGGIAINVLPILMTAINFISSSIYVKGFPLKTKIQLYGMALVFLVLLYTSPSGLVFYWTLNNLFSLVKTIFYKLKNPSKVLRILTFALGIGFIAFGGVIYQTTSLKRRVFLVAVGAALMLPMVLNLLKKNTKEKKEKAEPKNNKVLFVSGGIFMTVLVGLLIPSNFIAASPQEYVDITYFHNPMWYIVSAVCLAAGTFLIWMGVFYWIASPKGKVIFDRLIWAMCGVTLVNYMFFGTKLGNISATLQYDEGMLFELKERLLNTAVVIAIALVMYLFAVKWHKAASFVLISAIVALGGMSVVNMSKIPPQINEIKQQMENADDAPPTISLSRDGQNVVVLMLDRALGEYIPYIMNELPELEEQFDGFTYYDNVISYGICTNFGAPPLFGGYEYTPVEMNKRDDLLLVDKHNESLLVMPRIFSENGYRTTVIDPVYANYSWNKDVSIYDEYPDIEAGIIRGRYTDPKMKQMIIENNHRNFFCFGIMKTMPILLQPTIYDKGQYIQIKSNVSSNGDFVYTDQIQESISKATSCKPEFINQYRILQNLTNPSMLKISEDSTNTFLMLQNSITHEHTLLQEPEYIPVPSVDNTEYDAAHADRFVLNGKDISIDTEYEMSHYHVNVAALKVLGEWFDYMREEGIYDNTRIVIVSDHGHDLERIENQLLDPNGSSTMDVSMPLLMVKDFNSTGFTTSSEFMTNADTPTLAVTDLIENPVNPFTGKVIDSSEKTAHRQYITLSVDNDVKVNNGYSFLPSKWVSVEDSVWDRENWEIYYEDVVLKDHEFPEE